MLKSQIARLPSISLENGGQASSSTPASAGGTPRNDSCSECRPCKQSYSFFVSLRAIFVDLRDPLLKREHEAHEVHTKIHEGRNSSNLSSCHFVFSSWPFVGVSFPSYLRPTN